MHCSHIVIVTIGSTWQEILHFNEAVLVCFRTVSNCCTNAHTIGKARRIVQCFNSRCVPCHGFAMPLVSHSHERELKFFSFFSKKEKKNGIVVSTLDNTYSMASHLFVGMPLALFKKLIYAWQSGCQNPTFPASFQSYFECGCIDLTT